MGILGNMHWLANRAYRKYVLTRPPSTRRHHLIVACMPKSGSSYLTAILGRLPGMRIISLVPGYDRREQELDISMLRSADNIDYVAHHHIRFSRPTMTLLNHFCIKPIVQVRNIFDIVVSLRDHLRNESLESSMGYVAPGMERWDDEQLERFIVQMMLPWYFNFYMSWRDCESKCLVRYEELIRHPESVVTSICEQTLLKCSAEQIAHSIQAASQSFTRKNKGVAGRGQSIKDETRNLIHEMAAYYVGVDFSPIGL